MRVAAVFTIICCLFCGAAFCDEICFLALDKDKVAPGKQVMLSLIVPGDPGMNEPEIPFVNGLTFKYQKTDKRTVEMRGKAVESTIYIYRVIAMKEGSYRIGPVSSEYKGTRYLSDTVTLEVSKKFLATREIIPEQEVKSDLGGHIYLVADMPDGKILVNQKIPLSIKLFSDWFDVEDISVSDISSTDLVVERFQKGQGGVITKDGIRYAVLEYKASILAPAPGAFNIEPVKVSLNLSKRRPSPSGQMPELLNDNEDFYDRILGPRDKMPLELFTKPIAIIAEGLPKKGRPDDFRGAIGSYDLKAEVSPVKLKEGDPLTVRLTVTGTGNFNTITGIDIPRVSGFKYFDPEIARGESSFVLTQTMRLTGPATPGFPAITFSFYDPAKGEYVSISKGPFPLELESLNKPSAPPVKAAFGTAGAGAGKPSPGELIPMKSSIGMRMLDFTRTYPGGILAAVISLPLLLLLISIVVKRRMDFLDEDIEYANWLRAAKRSPAAIEKAEGLCRAGRVKEFYDGVFGSLRDYLGLRLLVPSAGITERTISDMLDGKIEDPVILETINRIFSDCHIARFTSVRMDREDMERTLKDMKDVIEYFNRKTYLLNI